MRWTGVHDHGRGGLVATVKVKATVTMFGLNPGQEAEIDLDERVRALIKAGYLILLRPKTDG